MGFAIEIDQVCNKLFSGTLFYVWKVAVMLIKNHTKKGDIRIRAQDTGYSGPNKIIYFILDNFCGCLCVCSLSKSLDNIISWKKNIFIQPNFKLFL